MGGLGFTETMGGVGVGAWGLDEVDGDLGLDGLDG